MATNGGERPALHGADRLTGNNIEIAGVSVKFPILQLNQVLK